MRLYRIQFLIVALLLAVTTVGAQDTAADTTRDPVALAQRLLGFDADYTIPPLTPRYSPGDTAEFWVGKTGSDTPTKITANLAGVSRSLYQGVYLWAEEGLAYNVNAMNQFATQVNLLLLTIRQRGIYGEPTIIPDIGRISDPTSLLRLPDVDNDPHLFIIYTTDLGSPLFLINYHDQLLEEMAPGGYSNQHETILLNTSALPDAPLDNPAYMTILTQAFYEFIMQVHAPQQDQWLKEALATYLTRQLELPQLRPDPATAFILQIDTSLIRPVSATNDAATEGSQQIFMDYAAQRFGLPLVENLFFQPGRGLEPFDRTLEVIDALDLVTGKRVTGNALFADYVVANVTSYVPGRLFGDGRYLHRFAELPLDAAPPATLINGQLNLDLPDQSVNQYGARYYVIGNPRPAAFTLTFTGEAHTPLLPLPADSDPANRFYWSGRDANQNALLTRVFDLSEVEAATLTFDMWYDLPEAQDYVYVVVSADDGATWDMLAGDLRSANNRLGLAYGPGYTGISSREQPRPFPFLGVLLDSADGGLTITEVTPGGPASHSGLRAGDVVIGVDGAAWAGAPLLLDLLATDYEAGETIDLYVQRGAERLTIPVELGEHPSRIKLPEAAWVSQEIDLSAYAGQEILLRFEYVSQPQGGGQGVALDNIAIPEIEFLDDAEGENDWTLHGWQQVANQVSQRFLVQYISPGTQQNLPRVRHLIGPHDEATAGEWRFTIQPDEVIIYAVSALNHDTLLPASYDLVLREVTE
jgi:hypothetical protein